MEAKRMAAEKAVEYVKEGMILGLGTGSTAYYMIKKVGELISEGMNLKAVATSKSSENLANEFNIPLISIDKTDRIDLVIDGVDEIDGSFNAVKGGGGALFREKIVASIARSAIWIIDESKLVDAIGRFPLPVEILPFGHTHILKQLSDFSLNPVLRLKEGKIYKTDNGNYIADLHIGKRLNIEEITEKLNSVSGVLEVGLFLNMCEKIIVGSENGVKIIENPHFQKK